MVVLQVLVVVVVVRGQQEGVSGGSGDIQVYTGRWQCLALESALAHSEVPIDRTYQIVPLYHITTTTTHSLLLSSDQHLAPL